MTDIAHNRLTPMPQNLGIVFVTMTTVIMAYSHLVPVIPILVMYGMWFPFLYYKKQFSLQPSRDVVFVLLFASYCLLSTLWSDYPGHTLYAATQYMSMIVCALIMLRRLSLENFLKGLTLGIFLVLIPPAILGPMSFVHLFGSRNQVGYFSEIGIICSIFLMISTKTPSSQKIFFGIMPLGLSLILLALSHSATSIISTASVLCVCLGGYMIGSLPKTYRAIVLLLIIALIASAALCLYAFQIDLFGEILEIFGKDRTLTGRTDLWQDAFGFAMNHPILGDGYNAFWVEGRKEAEQLWEEFYIPAKTGFHFHNVFMQSWVDLGAIGVFFVFMILATFCVKSLKLMVRNGCTVPSILLLGLGFMFLTRAFSEVDFINPFGMGPFILYATFSRLFESSNIVSKNS